MIQYGRNLVNFKHLREFKFIKIRQISFFMVRLYRVVVHAHGTWQQDIYEDVGCAPIEPDRLGVETQTGETTCAWQGTHVFGIDTLHMATNDTIAQHLPKGWKQALRRQIHPNGYYKENANLVRITRLSFRIEPYDTEPAHDADEIDPDDRFEIDPEEKDNSTDVPHTVDLIESTAENMAELENLVGISKEQPHENRAQENQSNSQPN
jgi:hypothetical protein